MRGDPGEGGGGEEVRRFARGGGSRSAALAVVGSYPIDQTFVL
jgi:hypothetical protein